MTTELLVAISDGFVDDPRTGLVEITAGRTRIAPSLLSENPDYGEFFDRDVTAPGTDANRAVRRITLDPARLKTSTNNASADPSWPGETRHGGTPASRKRHPDRAGIHLGRRRSRQPIKNVLGVNP